MREIETNRKKLKKRRKRRILIRRCIGYFLLVCTVLVILSLLGLLFCGFLYINEHFLQCPAEQSESTSTNLASLKETQKDTKHSSYPSEQDNLIDHSVIVTIDAGHGGIQPGCEFNGVLEKDITLSVALLLQDELEGRGFTVIMTRNGDEDVKLDDRCKIANEAGSDFFVSIHCNSYTDDLSVNGFEGYYYKNQVGKRLAELILQSAQGYSIKTRHVNEENYYVLKDTNMPAVLLEIGFMSNEAERERLQTTEYQTLIAKSIADGIAKMTNEGFNSSFGKNQ